MMRKLAAYTRGTLWVSVAGESPERFINMCLQARILLWEVRKTPQTLFVCVAPADFKRLRPVVRATGARVRILQRRGWPFLAARLLRRKMLWGGAMLFCCGLYWLSSFVWLIDITGADKTGEEQVRKFVEQEGLRPGIERSLVDARQLEKKILLAMPELAWVGIKLDGIHAVVEVVEKVVAADDDEQSLDLTAAKTGVISEMITLAGQPLAHPGDNVQAGDVLISGIEPEPGATPVKAKGIVLAQIVYECYGEATRQIPLYSLTGQRAAAVQLRVGDGEWLLNGSAADSFGAYELEKIVKQFHGWNDSQPIAELIINVYNELNVDFMEIDSKEARCLAVLRAVEASRELIERDAKVLERNIDDVESEDLSSVKVRLRIVTEEEIGKYLSYNRDRRN